MSTQTTITPDLGLNEDTTKSVVDILKTVLADQHVLYMKLRNYHWNVTGPHFFSLHEAFEKFYNALSDQIDSTAERIRAYGVLAPGTLEEMKSLSRLSESPGDIPDARTMVVNIVADYESLVRTLRADIDKVDELDDDGAEDFLIGLLQDYQDAAWMFRSYLED